MPSGVAVARAIASGSGTPRSRASSIHAEIVSSGVMMGTIGDRPSMASCVALFDSGGAGLRKRRSLRWGDGALWTLVQECGDPGKRRVPVDGFLVRRPCLDVVGETFHRRAPPQPRRLDVQVLEAGIRPAGQHPRRRAWKRAVRLVRPEAMVRVF